MLSINTLELYGFIVPIAASALTIVARNPSYARLLVGAFLSTTALVLFQLDIDHGCLLLMATPIVVQKPATVPVREYVYSWVNRKRTHIQHLFTNVRRRLHVERQHMIKATLVRLQAWSAYGLLSTADQKSKRAHWSIVEVDHYFYAFFIAMFGDYSNDSHHVYQSDFGRESVGQFFAERGLEWTRAIEIHISLNLGFGFPKLQHLTDWRFKVVLMFAWVRHQLELLHHSTTPSTMAEYTKLRKEFEGILEDHKESLTSGQLAKFAKQFKLSFDDLPQDPAKKE
jgi:hypothetical protein